MLKDLWNGLLAQLRGWITNVPLDQVVRASIILVVGWILSTLASRAVVRLLATRPLPHRVIARRFVFFGLMGLVVATVLHQIGFNLGPLFGAAGILTVAVGFASQTSASNLISGLFLLTEQAVEVGDAITVAGISGEVTSIDLLSTKLRTFDNTLVRIPNETMIKTEVVVLTKFPIRRADIDLPISPDVDLTLLERELRQLAREEKEILDEPEPVFVLLGYTESAITVRFGGWAEQKRFIAVRTRFTQAVQRRLRELGIGLAVPRRRIEADDEQTEQRALELD
ncbi:MAG: mechanosensitive ion channel family protein [Acidobacteria bacterium]|nr:MAG: mechanosensitive ion channel family protein [Acidobacteriota bacterium]REK08551.1 MAG: mechanosensitive ion channel family protein [Acidobacteriota bacterium]